MELKLDNVLKGKTSVGISGHVKPDGDCVGSTLAVYNYIKTWYPDIDVHIYLQPIPEEYRFLANSDAIELSDAPVVHDLFIALDCSDIRRLDENGKHFEAAKETLCIDHHLNDGPFADTDCIYPESAAACELVFQAMDEDKITKEIAECLYSGIVSDTGVFQFKSTSKLTMDIAGKLMEKGIDYSTIVDKTYHEKTYAQNRILGAALVKAKLHCNGRIISSYISWDDMKEYGASLMDLEGIVQQLRITQGVDIAIFMHDNDNEGETRVSTRAVSACDVNLADVAKVFNGGGHAKAAGLTLHGDREEGLKKLIAEIEKRF
ncbi:MAG: bifunctional oligoribonuclease/PAP phosphatase NrnA [Lachnospiraceae bacterium]|nr:bifunctional oligoribonuclease/PAP phosphatase NrnA [Lachnospiraceae bacterium]